MLDGRFKANIEKGLRPIGTNLRRTGITADHLTALGVVMAAGRGRGHRRRPAAHRPAAAHPHRAARRARRRGGQGVGHGLAPGCLLRLGVRSGLRLAAAGRRGLVPGQHPPRPPRRCCPWPCWRRRSSSRTSGPRPSRSGFAAKGGIMERAERDHPARLRPAVRLAARRRAVDHAGADAGHRRAAVRQGVATGQRRAAAGLAQAAGPAPGRSGHPQRPSRRRRCGSAGRATAALPDPGVRLGPLDIEPVSTVYRAGSAFVRAVPRPVAEHRRRPGQLDRRRGLGRAAAADRAQPAARARPGLHRRAAASGRPPDVPLLHALLGRLVPAAQAVGRPDRRRLRGRGLRPHRAVAGRRASVRSWPCPTWAGGSGPRSGSPRCSTCRSPRWSRRSSRRSCSTSSSTSAGSWACTWCRSAPRPVPQVIARHQGRPRGLPAVGPRHRRRRDRGRLLRREDHAAARPGDRGPAHRGAADPRRGLLRGRRPPRRRRPAARPDPHGPLPRRRDPPDPGPGRARSRSSSVGRPSSGTCSRPTGPATTTPWRPSATPTPDRAPTTDPADAEPPSHARRPCSASGDGTEKANTGRRSRRRKAVGTTVWRCASASSAPTA